SEGDASPENVIENTPLVFLKGEILNPEEVPQTMALEPAESGTAPEVVWTEVEHAIPEEDKESLMEEMMADKAVTSVGYANVLPGISLQYILQGNSLKEYILVNQKQDSYHYDFLLNLENLVPEQKEDGRILLKDPETEEAVYEIPAGYMTDAAGAYSEAVAMELMEGPAEGTWILRIAADYDWMNAEERVFPVQIDPTISHTLEADNCVRGSYVMELHPQSSRVQQDFISVGYSNEDGELRSYIQLKNLPQLPKDSVVCDARCNFVAASYSQVSFLRMNVLAKEITGNNAWGTNFTWNNRPTVSESVMDYQILKRDTPGYFVGWNITELVKKHYLEGNTSGTVSGFALEAYGADTMDSEDWANSLLCMDYDGAYPILQIIYRDSKGLEGYYTYQTHSMGNAGTVYVSDYSGKLTVVNPVASYESTIMPYGLSLVYNSNYNNKYFTKDGDDIHTGNFTNMKLGAGWKLSAQETVTEVQLPDETDSSKTVTWLIYNDSDGTEHYFKAKTDSTTVFEDEDGLNLTITKGDGVYTMKDKKDNVKTFKNGYLTKIMDANGNAIHIVYNGLTVANNTTSASGSNRITSVYIQPKDQAADRIFGLVYNTSGFLTAIKEIYGKEYKPTYVTYGNVSYLKQISIYDGSTTTVCAKYGYEDINRHMTHVADAETDRGIYYIYEKSVTGYRVSYFHEYAVSQDANVGRKVSVTSDGMQRTSYRDYGADNSYGTGDDIFTTYLFNGYGHTINVNSTDNKDTILGITAGAYTEKSGTAKTNNRVTSSIAGGQAGVNLLKNSSFEKTYTDSEGKPQATGWNLSGSGSAACRDENPRNGGKHYNLYNANTSQNKLLCQTVTLKSGKDYTLSAYVNTENMTSVTANGGVQLAVLNSNNTPVKEGDLVTHWTDSGVDGGWQRMSLNFTVTSNGTYKVAVQWKYNIGTVRVEDVQLEEAQAPSGFNLVSNGSFENGTTDWTVTKLALTTAQENAETKKYIHGSSAFSTQGIPDSSFSAKQTIQINRSSDTTFLLSGWSKADSVPDIEKKGNDDTKKFWGLTLKLVYADDNNTEEYHSLPFAAYSTEWQYASMAIVPKEANKTISHAELTCCYYRNANTARFDSISLTEEPCQTYKYNSEGNLTSVKSTGNGSETYNYNDTTQNLMSVGTEGSGTFHYEYSSGPNKHLPVRVTNDSASMAVTYDPYGEAIQTKLSNT
ncbi:MAG: DNRLRE domain-containing protein, partial [Firmicutes bacterium]|nr:DNRLRE domain-containing protein [Bacillota bacterium]